MEYRKKISLLMIDHEIDKYTNLCENIRKIFKKDGRKDVISDKDMASLEMSGAAEWFRDALYAVEILYGKVSFDEYIELARKNIELSISDENILLWLLYETKEKWKVARAQCDSLNLNELSDMSNDKVAELLQDHICETLMCTFDDHSVDIERAATDRNWDKITIISSTMYTLQYVYDYICRRQIGMPTHILDYGEIEDLAENCFFSRNMYVKKAILAVQKTYDVSKKEATDIIADVQRRIMAGCEVKDIIWNFYDEFIKPITGVDEYPIPSSDNKSHDFDYVKKFNDTTDFIRTIKELYGNTPQIYFRGHTNISMYDELVKIGKIPESLDKMIQEKRFQSDKDSFKAEDAEDILKRGADFLKDLADSLENAGAKDIPTWTMKNGEIISKGSHKIYPNDPCLCGSGKKYKQCCGNTKS